MGHPHTVHLEGVFMRAIPPKTDGWLLWQQTQQSFWAQRGSVIHSNSSVCFFPNDPYLESVYLGE